MFFDPNKRLIRLTFKFCWTSCKSIVQEPRLSNFSVAIFTIDCKMRKNSTISMGVQQGSNLLPLLFLVFVNGVDNSNRLVNFNIPEVASSVYISGENVCNLYILMNAELDKLGKWILANWLSLMVEKTINLLFSGKQKNSTPSKSVTHV